MHAAPAIPSRFDSFRIVENYEKVARDLGVEIPAGYADAHACAARIEELMTRAGARPRPLPQRPPGGELHLGRPPRADRRLGVRGHGRPLLRPRELRGQQRAPAERSRTTCSSTTSAGRRPQRQLATLHLFTFMSDFREAMWGVVQQGASDIEFDFADYADEALPPAGRDRRGARVRRRPGGRAWRLTATRPTARAA